jgi:hypothetical protein
MLVLCASALASPEDDFGAAVDRMFAAVAAVEDATFVLHQQEYAGGRLRDPVVMTVKYRPPNDVYVEWPDGQRLLWVPSTGATRMRVDPPLLPVMSLAPDGMLAMRNQRHSIRRMGLQPVADLFAADAIRLRADPTLLAVVDLGPRTVLGTAARCFEAKMDKAREPALYAAKVEVCVDPATGLPVQMTSWDHEDGELRLVEQYGYEAMRVNVGLTAADFDAAAHGL